MTLSKSLLAAAAGAILLFAAPAANARHHDRDNDGDQNSRTSLTVYQEDNFGGDSRDIRDDVEDLDWIHFDDRISSVEVHGGVWEFCEHAHFRGHCITVDHDIRRLDRMGFDDRTSSIRRLR